MIPFLITLIFSQSLFATTTFRISIRDGMKFYFPWPRSHLMMSWKGSTSEEHASLNNSKPYWSCMTWKFIRKTDVSLWKVENDGEEKHGSETSITKFCRQKWEDWDRCSGYESQGLSGVDRGQGVCYQWNAKEQCPSGDKCSVVLISRLFSVEHAIVGNEARAERIKYSHCVLMIGVFPFFIDYTIVRSGTPKHICGTQFLARGTARTSQTCATVVSRCRSSCPWRRRASDNISFHKRLWRDVFVVGWIKFQPAHTNGTADPRTSRIQELCGSLLGICLHQAISCCKDSSGLWPDQFLSTESGYSCSHFSFNYGFLLQSARGRELHFISHTCLSEQTLSCFFFVTWDLFSFSDQTLHCPPNFLRRLCCLFCKFFFVSVW